MRTNGGIRKFDIEVFRYWVELAERIDGERNGRVVRVDYENALEVAIAMLSIMSPEERDVLVDRIRNSRVVETRGGESE